MNNWYADTDFWNGLYPFIFDEEKEGEAAAQVDAVLALTGVEQGRVLDMPCGPGRHARHLAARGFQVTGVDLDPGLLERARARVSGLTPEADFEQGDMRQWCRPDHYDLAISMFNSLGYFADEEDDIAVLTNMARSLRPGGRALLEMVSKEYLASIFEACRQRQAPDGTRLEQHMTVVEDWTRIRNTWTVVDSDREPFVFEQTIFSGRELKRLMEQAGFEHIRLHGHLDGRPYDQHAERLIAIGMRECA